MHRISYIRAKNFRACKDVEIHLDDFTPLVGPNNAGKSTLLESIAWVLKPTALSLTDFTDAAEEVDVVAHIEGIDASVREQIPNDKHRKAIEPYCRDGHLWIRARTDGTTVKSITREVWTPDTCPGDDVPTQWRTYPTGLPEAVSAILPEALQIRAMHDIDEDLGKARAGTTIKGLLEELIAPLVEQHAELQGALDTINDLLTLDGSKRSEHLVDFDKHATQALSDFFPGLSIEMDLSSVLARDLFKAGDINVTDAATGGRRRFSSMGSGAQRAIQMSLIRHLAERNTPSARRVGRRLLLIDEPELYLHPRGVVRLRDTLKKNLRIGVPGRLLHALPHHVGSH